MMIGLLCNSYTVGNCENGHSQPGIGDFVVHFGESCDRNCAGGSSTINGACSDALYL
jgi:hypothetical protein